MSEEQSRYRIPEDIRKRILASLREEIGKTGYVDYSAIGSRVLRGLQINWGDYAGSANRLSEWLRLYFPEVEPTPDNRGVKLKNAPLKEKVTQEVRNLVAAAIRETLAGNESALLSDLGSSLVEKGVDRKRYTGESLGDWIRSLFPNIQRTEDGLRFYRGTQTPIPAPVPTPTPVPAQVTYPASEKTLSQVDLDENIRQMHAVSYMGWWSNNIRFLKRYTGCNGNDTRIWSGIVAQYMTDVFLGRREALLGEPIEGEPSAAFYAGMDTPDGKPIYCVLTPNADKKAQSFMVQDFSWAGDEENPVLSQWLAQSLPGQSGTRISPVRGEIRLLEESCRKLEPLRVRLEARLEEMLACLRAGEALPEGQPEELDSYRENWQKIRTLCETLEVPETLLGCEQILAWCAAQNPYAVTLKQIANYCHSLAGSLAALLAPYGLSGDTMDRDRTALDQACDEFRTHPDTTGLRTLLQPWLQLRELMKGPQPGQDMQALFAVNGELEKHFGFITMSAFGLEMRPDCRAAVLAWGGELDALLCLLDELDAMNRPEEPAEAPKQPLPEPRVLLDAVCRGDVMAIWTAFGGENPLETLILEDRLPEALTFAYDREAMEAAGYDELTRLDICSRLEEGQSLPEGYVLHHIALRLSRVLGPRNATAERYFLMGMFAERSQNVGELLKIYRQTGREEDFLTLWERFGADAAYCPENYRLYLQYLMENRPDQLQTYLDSHVYLYHLADFADLLGEASEVPAELPQPNALEALLLADDREQVLAMQSDPSQLEAMGYTAEEITRIFQTAISESGPTGTGPYQTGMRIYRHQGNLHGLAERLLWEGLARNPGTEICNKLVPILAEEGRWHSCIRLFGCYAGNGISSESSQAYLLAMLHTEPAKILPEIRTNLRGFLALAYQDPRAAAAVDGYRLSGGEGLRDFYESLHRILSFLEEDYPRSVLLHDRSFRDLVTQPALLTGLELTDSRLESARALYQSGNYPQGPDAESVAKRAYAFLGTYHGIAEELARFCLPQPGALSLLWDILGENGDIGEQNRLLENYPALRQLHPHDYSQYLFRSGQDDAFLEWLASYERPEEPSVALLPVEELQKQIALVRTGSAEPVTVPRLTAPLTPEMTGYLAQLTATLAAEDRLEDLAELLLGCFDLLLTHCDQEHLAAVMTAGGKLTTAAAEKLQSLTEREFRLALYYYNILSAGDLAARAEEYYRSFLESCDQGTLEERLRRTGEMAKLYPGRHQDLNNRMYRMQVAELLKTEPYTKEVQNRLAEALQDCPLESGDIRGLMTDVENSVYAFGDGVVRSIDALSDRDELLLDGLGYLHRTALAAGKKSGIGDVLSRSLCNRYLAVLDRDSFPVELGNEAELLCRRILLGNPKRYEVAFCLYRIELCMGHHSRAEVVLRHLSMQLSSELGSLYPVVEAAAEDFWADKVPGMLHTFTHYVHNHTPGEIQSYCEFSRLFAHASDTDWTQVHDLILNMRQQRADDSVREYSPCTQEEGEALVKVLCAAPDKADYWWGCTMLPGLSQSARAKLLLICGRKNANMYKECVLFTVETCQDDILLQVLGEWVNAPSPGPKNCRAWLADMLVQEPGFFDRWTSEADTAQVQELLERLCCDISEDMGNLPSNVAHTALNAVASIAVAIGTEASVELLERYLSVPLFTRNTEVGVAAVLRLLLADRSNLARNLLEGLHHSTAPIACRLLVEQLHALTPEALAEQIHSQIHRSFWGMLLPDGNRPAAPDIYQFVMQSLSKNRIAEGARVVNMLLDIFPGDYVLCDALFILCKYPIEDQIPMLHKALCGLVCGSAAGGSYYRRNFLWNARLLAGLNAVIKARGLEQAVRNFHTGYDFDQEAGHFCLVNQASITGDEVKDINSVQRTLTHSLQNLHEEELDFRCGGIVCWVTGNWIEFLHTAWLGREEGGDVSSLREILQFRSIRSDYDSVGFCRSLLVVAGRLEPDQRMPFLQWVLQVLTVNAPPPRKTDFHLSGKLRQCVMAMDLISSGVPDKLGELSLELPLDEYSLMSLIFSGYIQPCVGKDTELLYHRLWTLGAVADHPPMMLFQYFNPAQAAFREGDNKTAAAYFEAMLRLLDRGLSRDLRIENREMKTFSFNKELYEGYARISRLKAGDAKMIQKIGSSDFHVWSCFNMMVALICSPRGNEALQLTEYFADANRTLARALLRVIDPAYPEQKKMDLLTGYPNCLEKVFLAYAMRSGVFNGASFDPFFFKDSRHSMTAKQIYVNLAKQYPRYFDCTNASNPRPKHFLLSNFNQINAVSYKQRPLDRTAPVQPEQVRLSAPEEPGQTVTVVEAVLPAFARSMTPLDQPERLEQLLEEYNQLPHFRRYYQDRLDRSAEIYRIRLSMEQDAVNLLPDLIRYGLDYYDRLDLDNPEEFSQAYRSVTELVAYADALRTRAEDSVRLGTILQPLETAVENSIIYTLLDKGHLTIQSLVSQFAQDRRIFGILQGMVRQDPIRKEALAVIYNALDMLAESYSASSNNTIVLRNALNRARSRIGSMNYGAWQGLKNKLQGLIQNEVNSIDRRPILDLEIQNRGINPEEDYLYGEIWNEGMESAQDITLQVAYEDSSSDRLRLAQLAPNEHVAFKIRYSAPEGARSLRYTINWSYVFNGQTYIQPIKEDTLDIAPLPDPAFPVNQYETQTITDFYEDENGVLGNPNFFGRERETEELRNLFRSGRFPSYNNAIVYGIRRAGKTTLLNYVQAYVSLHCEDAIIVKVDCLIDTGTRLVQSLFIDRVLSAIQIRYSEFTETESWQWLVDKWTLAADAPDRDPSSLELFYGELKRVTGKGLILMLDEVDNFFTSVEQQTSLDSYLFQVLSNMLCSANCQQVVHFIFCGSKYLLRYRSGDGGLSQLFQRFGSNIIEVGLIPKSEMQRMIRKPYEDHPEVVITDGAIDWIWEYTQGLVWHVKLLANMVLRHVRDSRRSVVYPVDVKDNIHNLVQKAYCEQFFDGINGKEKDKRERLVVDAMQSMASLRTSNVPRDLLVQLLTSNGLPPEYRMTMDQLETALDNLVKLKLITYSESNQSYRFPVDLYRLYFRSQREFPFVFRKVAAPEQTFLRI